MLRKLINLDILKYVCIAGDETHQELNFGALLEPKLRKLFYETYDELPEQFSKIFHINTSKKAKETDYGLGAMTPWAEFGSSTTAVSGVVGATTDLKQMPEVPYEVIDSGLERTYTHKEFAKGFKVERKFVDDEMYGVIEKLPKDLARAGRYKVETDGASILNNAFTGSGYDSKPLISDTHGLINTSVTTVHGTGVSSNLATGALSDASLKVALQLGRKQYDEAGKLIQYKFDTLVVPPALEFVAYELIRSSQKVGTNNNDINSLQGRLTIVVDDFLTSDTAWFLMDSKRHQLNWFWRVKPEFKREEDFNTLVQQYRGYMRYSFGYSDYRGIIGSTGL